MHQNGVHTLAVHCGGRWCNHEAILAVSGYADDLTVPAFGPHMVCNGAELLGLTRGLNWKERAAKFVRDKHLLRSG
jgi:hypothetical protein